MTALVAELFTPTLTETSHPTLPHPPLDAESSGTFSANTSFQAILSRHTLYWTREPAHRATLDIVLCRDPLNTYQ